MKQKTISPSIGTNTCEASSITQNSNAHTTVEDNRDHTTGTRCDIQDTDYSEFLIKLAASREKVEALMRKYFDDDGKPRKKTASEANVAKDFDWSLYV